MITTLTHSAFYEIIKYKCLFIGMKYKNKEGKRNEIEIPLFSKECSFYVCDQHAYYFCSGLL